MNQVVIRSASFSDADALAELSGQLGYPSSSAEILKRLQVITAQQGHQVLVALIDAQMVGWSLPLLRIVSNHRHLLKLVGWL